MEYIVVVLPLPEGPAISTSPEGRRTACSMTMRFRPEKPASERFSGRIPPPSMRSVVFSPPKAGTADTHTEIVL